MIARAPKMSLAEAMRRVLTAAREGRRIGEVPPMKLRDAMRIVQRRAAERRGDS